MDRGELLCGENGVKVLQFVLLVFLLALLSLEVFIFILAVVNPRENRMALMVIDIFAVPAFLMSLVLLVTMSGSPEVSLRGTLRRICLGAAVMTFPVHAIFMLFG